MDDKIKIILVGESTVGKTCIINQYVNQSFQEEYTTTIGGDRLQKEIEINNKKLNLEIWDTAGQEQYRAINKIFMKNTKIAILVYSIVKKETFEQLDYWYESVKNNNSNNVLFVVVGNKNDLYEQREVEEEEGKKWAEDNNCLFFESSAKDYESIENIFNGVCEKYLISNQEQQTNQNQNLNKPQPNPQKDNKTIILEKNEFEEKNNHNERRCC